MQELVDYLNTLHRLNGSNINTTAEANVNNKYASLIIDEDEDLINNIISKLENGGKVLLTGFAGDGKTTLAQIIAKRLSKKEIDFSQAIINFSYEGGEVVVIKDLSEISNSKSTSMLYDELSARDKSLLLVSNTGTVRATLLDIYNKMNMWKDCFGSSSSFETAILSGLECGESSFEGEIKIGEVTINVFNLVKRDNLESAKRVLKKILDLPDWNVEVKEGDPIPTILLNVRMMKANNYLAVERMFYIYRVAYEYGERLTMRKLLEHFAYTITGGCSNVRWVDPNNIFFVENFFGSADQKAKEIDGIKIVKKFDFASNISSSWKRSIWNGEKRDQYKIELEKEIYKLDRYAPLIDENAYLNHYYKREDQISILRMIFFLNNVDISDPNMQKYISGFLNSPSFFQFLEIQTGKGEVDRSTVKALGQVIRRVLRDYCSGMKMPNEGASSDKDIFITMARKSKEISQATQIVLGRFNWNKRSIEITATRDNRGIYQYYLKVRENGEKIDQRMILDLPLLDYLYSIDAGRPLEDIDSLFKKRLENIKLNLHLACSTDIDEDEINLIYRDINNSIHSLTYSFDKSGRINTEDE